MRIASEHLKSSLPLTHHTPRLYTGPSYDEVVNNRSKYMPAFYVPLYKKPLLIVEGHLQYLWDHTGKRYLDLAAGISTINVGHSHPRISKVVKDQADILTHTSAIYMNQYQAEYSKMLCESLGEGFNSVFLTNSGGQANDFAMTVAKMYTGCNTFLSLRNAYHGLVGGAKGLTNVGTWNLDMIRGIDHQKLSPPYEYRKIHEKVDGYYRECDEILQSCTSGKIAGFIVEPVMGVGGIIPMPNGYMKEIFARVRKYGGLCISDEVQTGFGRIGKEFWGFKWQEAKPDIVTMAKAIGNGLPLGAVVTRKQITDTINKVYFNTYSGGPIQCRVGMEVLRILKEEKLHQNAEKVGKYILDRLAKIQPRCKNLGDVRGKGLLIALQIVKDQNSKLPDLDKFALIMDRTRELGLLLSKGGVHGNVVRIQPPLCISMEDAIYAVDVLEQILTAA